MLSSQQSLLPIGCNLSRMSNDRSTALLTILTEAIAIEIYGQEYYSIFSDLVPDEKAAAMFKRLSHDEGEHRELLEKEYKTISGKSIDMRILNEENREQARRIFPESLAPMNLPETGDALKLGIRTEERSIELYENSALQADNGSRKELFLKLVGIEEGHRDILEKALHHLKAQGSWDRFTPPGR